MNKVKFLSALLIAASCGSAVNAGILDGWLSRNQQNCDFSNSTTVVERPVIVRPLEELVRTYQRGFVASPLRCDTCAPGTGCTPGFDGHGVSWPCGPIEIEVSCTGSCIQACDPELQALIVESKTAAYARDRRLAVHKIGQRYSCAMHPHVMPALVYALNDCDETVRAKAADKIGDQLRRNPGCCTSYVLCALKLSLHDYDIQVRTQAEQALTVCGYRIVSPSKNTVTRAVYDPCLLPVSYPAAQPDYYPSTTAPIETTPYIPPRPAPYPKPVTPPPITVPEGIPADQAIPVPLNPGAMRRQPPRLKEPVPLAGVNAADDFLPPILVK